MIGSCAYDVLSEEPLGGERKGARVVHNGGAAVDDAGDGDASARASAVRPSAGGAASGDSSMLASSGANPTSLGARATDGDESDDQEDESRCTAQLPGSERRCAKRIVDEVRAAPRRPSPCHMPGVGCGF